MARFSLFYGLVGNIFLFFGFVACAITSEAQSLNADDDMMTVILHEPAECDILDNDLYPGCVREDLEISIVEFPQSGTVTVNADNTLTYTGQQSGYDFLRYAITDCNGNKVEASVRIAVIRPRSRQYIACPGATVIMAMQREPGFAFYWYDRQTGGNIVPNGNNVDTLSVIKDAPDDIGTWWVEVHYGTDIYPRRKVEIQTSNYCGGLDPGGCAAYGSIIYREDFRGNAVSDPAISTVDLIGGRSDLTFTSENPGSGYYALLKKKIADWAWDNDDHTFPKDAGRGYFMFIDPNPNQHNATLYEYDILNLCDGISNMSFTVWATDLNRPETNWVQPKVEMAIIDMVTHDTLVTTGVFTLPRETQPEIWRQYGFDFKLPAGVSDITFKLINKEAIGAGNDWGIDDIEIRLCAPQVHADVNGKSSDTVYCNNRPLTLSAGYTDDFTFISSSTDRLEGYWLQSSDNDINNPAVWHEVPNTRQTETAGDTDNSFSCTLNATDMGVTYYRYVISNSANVDKPGCRASSEVISVVNRDLERTVATVPDLCSGDELSVTVSSTEGASVKWYSDAMFGVLIHEGHTLTAGTLYGDTVFYAQTSLGSCTYGDTVRVSVATPPSVKAMDDLYICIGDEVTLSVLESEGAVVWNTEQTVIRPESTREYIVTATRHPCPDARDTVKITVGDSLYIRPLSLPVHKPDETYFVQLDSNAESPVYTVISGTLPAWLHLDESGILTGTADYNFTGTFTVQVADSSGCRATREYLLESRMFIPKVFTPNGDGINDIFMPGYGITVFDRLGTVIFRGENGWDGTRDNKPVAHDIYFYLITRKSESVGTVEKYTGYVGVEK